MNEIGSCGFMVSMHTSSFNKVAMEAEGIVVCFVMWASYFQYYMLRECVVVMKFHWINEM